MTPESVGVKQTSLVMGKHSGRHAFKDKMNSLGYPDLTDDVVSNAFAEPQSTYSLPSNVSP